MAVTETLRALGSWGLSFKKDMPEEKWKVIDYFGHIAILPGRRPGPLDDSLLRTARYVGPVTSRSDSSEAQRTIGGAGMALWLGDSESKGDVFLTAITVDGDFDDVIRALLPPSGSITEGTLFTTGETFGPSTFQYQTPRDVIDYVCQTIGGHAWRVNGDGTLDAGLESDLFVVTPKCVLARKNYATTVAGFDDMFLRGLAGMAATERDVEDYTTTVALLAQGINGQFVSAQADLTPPEIPFLDIHGNTVKRVRIIQESDTDATNAPARALLQLNRFKGTRDALTLSTSDYDIKGKAQVGDYIWVYDPSMDLVDVANEVPFRGQRINPFRLQLTETTWPVTRNMSVLYRAKDGSWHDLSRFVEPESGDTTLVVGGYNRSLTEGGSGTFPIVLPDIDTTVPDQVQWVLPWAQSQYQSTVTGETRSEVELHWFKPDNVGGSTMTDLAYYDIRYRQSAVSLTDFTLAEMDTLTDDISEWNTLENPVLTGIEGQWQFATAPAEVLKLRLQELTPGMTYEAQIRAVDSARPPHQGAWSALEAWQASRDVFPPVTPAPPEVAANPMAVLVTHKLGRASGGEFNLDRDLAFLEVHGQYEPFFNPTEDTLIGRMPADWGNLTGMIPVLANFQVVQVGPMYFKVVAIDQAGNRSMPSAAVVATAQLINDQYLGTLNVGKLISGTMTANLVVGNKITTSSTGTGARVEMSNLGIRGFSSSNQNLLEWRSSDGKLIVNGTAGIEINDGRLVVRNSLGNVIVEIGNCADGRSGIQVYKDDGSRVARIGELGLGPEGIEVINDLGRLVRVSTLAFGTAAGSLSTNQDRMGTGFGDMITVGPSCTVEVGDTKRMLVGVGAWCNTGATPAGSTGIGIAAAAGFDVAGPSYFSAANFFQSVRVNTNPQSGSDFTAIGATKFFLVDGLPNTGNYTITMKYSSQSNTNGAQFSDRHVLAIPF
jgi:hypothetical protein